MRGQTYAFFKSVPSTIDDSGIDICCISIDVCVARADTAYLNLIPEEGSPCRIARKSFRVYAARSSCIVKQYENLTNGQDEPGQGADRANTHVQLASSSLGWMLTLRETNPEIRRLI